MSIVAPGTRLGPYEILAPLGVGGMGEVWRARDTRLAREVAVKVLPADVVSDAARLKRFEKEALAASGLNHPNIVTIYDIGSSEATKWIAMEKVDGRTLREILSSGALPARRILPIAAQIADALACAHEAGIVHRDLKPENVMVTREGLVKLLDFGLAKQTRPESEPGGTAAPTVTSATEPGVVMGTVGYMSPEQAAGRSVDYRSDQFSLGSVLYEMATGERAFQGASRPEILTAILRSEPRPIEVSNPETPAPLRWLVERCLAKEPEDRFTSTKDLARDLASIRDHVSEASASGAAGAVPERRRRLRAGLAAAAMVAAVAAAFLAGRRLFHAAPPTPSYERLTFRSGRVLSARFTPDGQTIVYCANWGGPTADMFTTRAGSVESRALGISDAPVLSINSLGEMLVLRGATLSRVSLAGGAEREILEDVHDAAWAPNGRDIAAVHRMVTDGRGGLAAPSACRLEFPLGTVLYEAKYLLSSPAVSPRGDRVAFVEYPFRGSSQGWLSVVDSARTKRRLTEDFASIDNVRWSPSGDELWFSAAPGNEALSLRAVDLAGRTRILSKGAGDQGVEDVSAAGRALVIHRHGRLVLMVKTPADDRERELSWLDGSRPVAFSEDGKSLLFTETLEGGGPSGFSAWMRPLDGSPAVRLGEGMAVGLSPDGKWVLAVRHRPHPAQLVLIPTGAGETRLLTHDAINHRTASWLPDGRGVVFVGEEAGREPRLYVQDLGGGPPRAVSAEAKGGTLWMTWRPVAPDGRSMVWFDGEFRLYPLAGDGPPRPIPGLARSDVPIGWNGDGRSLYVRARGTPGRIALVDVATGEKRPWMEIGATRPDSQIVITPDGKSYAYSSMSETSDLYLVEGLR